MCGEVEGGGKKRERKRKRDWGWRMAGWGWGTGWGEKFAWKELKSMTHWGEAQLRSLSFLSITRRLCRIINFFPSLLLPSFAPPKPFSIFSESKAAWARYGRREGKETLKSTAPLLSSPQQQQLKVLSTHISEVFPKYTAPHILERPLSPQHSPFQWMWLQLPTEDP